MNIIGKRADGYLVECDGDGHSHSFVVESLGTAVHCPTCGDSDSSADLASNYIFKQHSLAKEQTNVVMMKANPMDPVDIANDYIYKRHSANHGQ